MDNNIKTQLGEFKYVNSVNTDINTNIFLKCSGKNIIENDIVETLDLSERYDIERQRSDKYKVYGGIEYLSLLNGLTDELDERKFSDYFIKNYEQFTPIRDIYNSFYFYLVKPSTEEYDEIYDNIYIRKFEIIADYTEIFIESQAYSKNIYGDEKYTYILNKDIDLNNSVDYFGLPITELYLMCVYRPVCDGLYCQHEGLYFPTFSYINNDIEVSYNTKISDESLLQYQIGDIIQGDVVYFDKEDYKIHVLNENIIRLITSFNDGSNIYSLSWKYDLFKKIKISDLSLETYTWFSGDTLSEPYKYAIPLNDNGDMIWRKVLDKGYIDNLYDIGVDYPFVNGKHYLFNNILLNISVDLDDEFTRDKFENIFINGYESLYNNLNSINLGDRC